MLFLRFFLASGREFLRRRSVRAISLLVVSTVTLSPLPLSAQASAKIPAKHSQVQKDTPLPTGTSLKIYQSFRWNDVTVLGTNLNGSVRVRFIGRPESWDNDFKRSLLIIAEDELERVSSNPEKNPPESEIPDQPDVPEKMSPKNTNFENNEKPSRFTPQSARTTTSPSPKRPAVQSGTLVSIPDQVPLVVGVPVRARKDNKFSDATIVEVIDSDNVKVRWAGESFNSDSEIDRADLVVHPKVLAILESSDAEARFALRGQRIIDRTTNHPYPKADYAIRIDLPKNAQRVTADTPLRIGAKVGLNNRDFITRRDRWWDATVIDLNWDDTVRIRIDGESTTLEGDIDRECLIVSAVELDRLTLVAAEESRKTSGKEDSGELVNIPPDLNLLRGTPVIADLADGPQPATIIDLVDDMVHVVSDAEGGSESEELPRSALQISRKAIDALKLPGTPEKLQRRADRIVDKAPNHPYPVLEYIPPSELPKNSLNVTDATPLEPGTILGLYSQNRWWRVQVQDLNWDGSVRIRVEGEGNAFDGDIERRCLVIQRPDLVRLENSPTAERSPFLNDKSQQSRPTSTDSPSPLVKSPPSKDSGTPTSGKYEVVLKSIGRKKIALAQVLADVGNLEYGDALKALDELPFLVASNLTKADADDIARKLQGAGAMVDVIRN